MDIVLNQASGEPIYNQIYSQISRQILDGTIKADEQLPTIRNIANELRISVIPVKMAWDSLEKNGFIYTVTGRGTFAKKIDRQEMESRHKMNVLNFIEDICIKARNLNLNKNEFLKLIEEKY